MQTRQGTVRLPPRRQSLLPSAAPEAFQSTEEKFVAFRRRLIEREASALREAGHYVELEFAARSNGMPEEKMDAAKTYDKQHTHRADYAQHNLAMLRYKPQSRPTISRFGVGLRTVQRNRFFVADKHEQTVALTPRGHKRKHRARTWRLEESLWVPRRDSGNSLDFFETPQALNRMLLADWVMARVHHQLAWYICQVQLPASTREELKKHKSRVTDSPVVVEVYDVLKRHAMVIYNAFDHYAKHDKKWIGTDATLNTAEVFYIRHNDYFRFASDCYLEDEQCNMGHIENIWAVVDAKEKTTAQGADKYNREKMLNRHEWVQALVRIAIRKFCRVDTDGMLKGNVAEAVESLCYEHLRCYLPPTALVEPNAFRKKYCYIESTDTVLKQHLVTLRLLYSSYAAVGNYGANDASKLEDSGLMSLGEWLTFVQHAGLFELELIDAKQALQAFAWCRIRSCEDYSSRSEMRLRHLFFEDFLEALVRMASVVALPTVEEVEAAGAEDAGAFMCALYATSRDDYKNFVSRRTHSWFEHPRESIHRCVGHLISIIVRVIASNGAATQGGGSVVFNKRVVDRCIRRIMDGDSLKIPSAAVSGDVLGAMRAVDEHMCSALRKVPAFAGLADEQIGTLRNALSVARYEDGEYAIEQGEEGDVFYLITGGEAEVLRVEPDDPSQEEVLLLTLVESDCFGERALLHNEPRAASVMAKGRLSVAYISRSNFEEVLGPLSSYRLDHNHNPSAQTDEEQKQEG